MTTVATARGFCLAALAGFWLACPAAAQSPDEKACILASAQKVPAIQGLTITGSVAKPLAKPAVVGRFITGFPNFDRAFVALNGVFGALDVELDKNIRRSLARGDGEGARTLLAEALVKQLAGSVQVDIAVKAAGVDASYAFACGWDGAGNVFATGMGLSR
jgi:hypothetical protein